MVATIEWLRLCPNAGAFPQTWHTLDMAGEYIPLPCAGQGAGPGRRAGLAPTTVGAQALKPAGRGRADSCSLTSRAARAASAA